jgi:Uma2 family endonuclease
LKQSLLSYFLLIYRKNSINIGVVLYYACWKKFLMEVYAMAIGPLHESENISRSGIPGTEEAFEKLISVESSYRYELIDGRIYDMTGSSPEHSAIAGNIDSLFREQLVRTGPCRTHRDQYVVIPGKPPVVPDVVVTCDLADWDKDRRLRPFKIQSPLIVVELLSPATERYDRNKKFDRYRSCTTLEVYILVNQDEQAVEIYRRKTSWRRELFTTNQVVKLDQLDLEIPLALVYEGIL